MIEKSGNIVYNEVQSAQVLLGYPIMNAGCCKVIIHPKWSTVSSPLHFACAVSSCHSLLTLNNSTGGVSGINRNDGIGGSGNRGSEELLLAGCFKERDSCRCQCITYMSWVSGNEERLWAGVAAAAAATSSLTPDGGRMQFCILFPRSISSPARKWNLRVRRT